MARVERRRWMTNGQPREAWKVTYRDPGTGRRTSGGQFDLKRDADAARRRIEQEIEQGTHVPKRQALTVAEVAEHMLEHDVKPRLRRRQDMTAGRKHNIQRDLRNHVLLTFGTLKVNVFTDIQRVQDWIDGDGNRLGKLEEISPKTGRRYTVKTVNGLVSLLAQVLSWAVKKNLGLKINPFAAAWPTGLDAEQKEVAFLEAEQVVLLLRWAVTRRRKTSESVNVFLTQTLAVLIALFAGLRCGEVCGLDWPNLRMDVPQPYFDVKQSYSKWDRIKEPKSRHGRRTIPMNGVLHKLLTEHWERCGRPKTGPVLRDRNGGRMKPSNLGTYHWPLAAKAAGVVDENGRHFCTFHGLRHTAGSLWLADGMPLEEVSNRLGHASVDFTRNIYLHQMKHDRRALQAIANVEQRFMLLMGETYGLQLPATPRPAELAPPAPMIDLTPDAVTIPAPAAPNGHVLDGADGHAPAEPITGPLLEWQRRAIELFNRNDVTVQNIARELRKGNREVSRFLAATGLYTPAWRGGPQFSDEQRERALAMYRETDGDGMALHPLRVIAEAVGAGESTVKRWAKDAGLTRPPISAGAKPRHLRERALALYEEGRNITEIARELGVGKTTITRWLNKEGAQRPVRERALQLWQVGKLATEIAVELGVPDYTVRQWAEEEGLKRAPYHRPDVACRTPPEERARQRERRRGVKDGTYTPVPRRPEEETAALKERAVAMWGGGRSDREIGAALGVAPNTVWNWCRAAGARRPTLEHGERWTRNARHRARALELWRADIPLAEIERELGVPGSTIRYWARAAGMPRRDRRFGPKPGRRRRELAAE